MERVEKPKGETAIFAVVLRQTSSYSLVPRLFLVEKEPGNIRGSKPFTLLHHHSCDFATVTELILKIK